MLLKMPFINKTRLTLNYSTKDGHLLLTVFNKKRKKKGFNINK